MCVECCRNPFHCIVPPHMLRVLEMRGDARQTEMARALLNQGQKVRDERAALTATPMLHSRGAADTFEAPAFVAAAPERHLNREVYTGEEKATLPGTLLRSEGAAPSGDPAGENEERCREVVRNDAQDCRDLGDRSALRVHPGVEQHDSEIPEAERETVRRVCARDRDGDDEKPAHPAEQEQPEA